MPEIDRFSATASAAHASPSSVRIALLSDIHGNAWALDAVLEDLERRRADVVLNLGDILYGPLDPRATFERVRASAMVSIRGNQDREIYEATAALREANATLNEVCNILGDTGASWLRSLPDHHRIDRPSGGTFACHGTPRSDRIYLCEDVQMGDPRVRNDAAILAELTGVQASLIVCGHSHIPRVVALSNGCIVVNPGSVGLPAYDDDAPVVHRMQTHSPHARYSIVEAERRGWKAEAIAVSYDHETAARQADERGRPDWAFALRHGRVPDC